MGTPGLAPLPTALITTGTQNKPISTHYYILSHNKNVVGLLDANGTITAAYEYDPYGQITSQTGPVAGLNPYRYSSELHNPVTGMVDYLHRTYNPLIGKYYDPRYKCDFRLAASLTVELTLSMSKILAPRR